jgi:two-component system CheB/CheR fusion protein
MAQGDVIADPEPAEADANAPMAMPRSSFDRETITLPEQEDASALTVVGLGGSAGCIPALEAFFQRVAPDSGSAYVVVLHLSPEYESRLAEVLGRSTSLRVQQVTKAVRIAPNQVYVIPPGRQLEMRDGTLAVEDLEQPAGPRVAIDNFFRTLAAAHGPQAAAVVFSGTGADGTLGIRQVKEYGGLAVAQSPSEAEYDAMPRSAIATGMVDYVLPASAMPAQIDAYWETSRRMRLPEEAAPAPEQREEGPVQEHALHDVLSHIRAQTGHDFSQYKRATVLRRIGRRMQVNGLESLPTYRDFLRSHPAEVGDLIGDLLISVTQFFRDWESWEALERDVLPRLFEGKTANDELRAWVCGCATGEEAYTLAILLLEWAERMAQPPRIQIFATDMDASAIAKGRLGIYPETITVDVSEERLRRWFYRHPNSYQVRKEVREAVLFASHDVLKDTPFSRLDLVTCRNLLIYLNREAQERVFDTFHFALRPDGRLMLGPSESADGVASLFGPTDKQHRLYVRRPVARSVVPLLPPTALETGSDLTVPSAATAAAAVANLAAPPTPVIPPWISVGAGLPAEGSSGIVPPQRPVSAGRELLRSVLEQLAPPSVLVDENNEIVHLSNGAGRFLHVTDGEPTKNLLLLVQPDLRIELRAILYASAAEQSDKVRVVRVGLAEGQPAVAMRLSVRRVSTPEGARGYALVLFEEALEAETAVTVASTVPLTHAPHTAATVSDLGASADEVARQLEREISNLQSYLRSTIEQYEALTEELKASNEELQAMNEEQRSSAEELETSKEELQSVNEELSTVNHELKARVEEVSRANSDLQNFLASTDIGTLFLDRELRIKRYTPTAGLLFNLIPTDVGRPLANLASRLDYPTLAEDAERVLERLVPVEREITSGDGQRHFLARLLPYRSQEDRIEGVIVTFVDISERLRAEYELRKSQERFRLLVEGARDYAMFLLDPDRRITFWSVGAERIFGWTEQETLGQSGDMIFTPEDREQGVPGREQQTALETGRAADRRWHLRKDGTPFWADGVMMRLGITEPKRVGEPSSSNAWGALHGFAKITRDATEEKRAEDAIRQANEELEQRVIERTREVTVTMEELSRAHKQLANANQELANANQELANANLVRRELMRRLVGAQEAERGHIARELHDRTGQIVTGLSLGLANLTAALPSPLSTESERMLGQLRALTDELGEEAHRLSAGLRPTALDQLGLVAALENYVEQWSAWSSIPVESEFLGLEETESGTTTEVGERHPKRLPAEVESTVYRVVQEALTNVLRHASAANRAEAGATQVSVTVQRKATDLLAIVEDDGPGFDVEAALSLPPNRQRLGLFGMKERAALIGGSVEIESEIGRGTTVYLRIPVESAADAPEAI